MTIYEHHRLDQCQAAIENGLAKLATLSEEEYQLLLKVHGDELKERMGDDWPVFKEMVESRRRRNLP